MKSAASAPGCVHWGLQPLCLVMLTGCRQNAKTSVSRLSTCTLSFKMFIWEWNLCFCFGLHYHDYYLFYCIFFKCLLLLIYVVPFCVAEPTPVPSWFIPLHICSSSRMPHLTSTSLQFSSSECSVLKLPQHYFTPCSCSCFTV